MADDIIDADTPRGEEGVLPMVEAALNLVLVLPESVVDSPSAADAFVANVHVVEPISEIEQIGS